MGKNISGCNGNTVQKFLVSLYNNQGNQTNVVFFQQLGREVTGTVGNNLYSHQLKVLSYYIAYQ